MTQSSTTAPSVLPGSTRRTLVAAAGATGALGLAAGRAQAAAGTSTVPVLKGRSRLIASRFSYGITPALAQEVNRRGGGTRWFEWQLRPDLIADRVTEATKAWWPGLAFSGPDAWQRHVDSVDPGWELMWHYQCWCLQRRIRGPRQVQEVMAEFWENHFNVSTQHDIAFMYRRDYGETLRDLALGTFADLLNAATTHPAMLMYLDQAVSTKAHPNENLGRELMELHTVGRGNYTEDDVKNAARILTGWKVGIWQDWLPSYAESAHWTGAVQVMGFSDANASTDGRPLTRRFLDYLAHHPATAHRIARKLAVKFVRDDPSDALVDHLANVYLANDTAIKPVLRALISSDEFRGSAGRKVRDPGEDLVATYRLLKVKVDPPAADGSAANAMLWQVGMIGQTPFSWPRPDGQPITNAAWASASRVINSMDIHYTMSGGWWPTLDAHYRSPAHWVPDFPIRFHDLVDHLSRSLLGRRADSVMLQGAMASVDLSADEKITRDHPLVKWLFPRFLTTFLDSPEFFQR
jgi:hypothetical protein